MQSLEYPLPSSHSIFRSPAMYLCYRLHLGRQPRALARCGGRTGHLSDHGDNHFIQILEYLKRLLIYLGACYDFEWDSRVLPNAVVPVYPWNGVGPHIVPHMSWVSFHTTPYAGHPQGSFVEAVVIGFIYVLRECTHHRRECQNLVPAKCIASASVSRLQRSTLACSVE